MKKSLYLILLLITATVVSSYAQQIVVKGTVIAKEDGLGIPGVNIYATKSKVGTITDFNGNYTLKLPSKNDTIKFSFIGYASQTKPVGGSATINITLEQSAVMMSEIVVTALGIKRDKKSLGYSIQKVDGEDLQSAKDVSVINKLSGKVAGLVVSSTNGGAAGSSRIVLRGNNSFNNNQALIVVDGVPIDNSTVSSATGEWGGKDYGNGISDINPDDIESVSVLKGASAAALYGSRAANGVILITTKKGTSRKGIGVTFSSSSSVDAAYLQKDFQNEYGAGSNGKFETHWKVDTNGVPHYSSENATHYSSWGPKMEGQEIVDWDGQTRQFLPQPDNYKNYFQTGYTLNNSVSLEGGKKDKTVRFTIADVRNRDIIPGAKMKRTNLGLSTNLKFFDKLTIQGYASFVTQRADNRPSLSDEHTNAARNYIQMPRHISSESLAGNIMNADGEEQSWFSSWNWMTNPYWNELYELSFDKKNRGFGNVSATYSINENLTFMLRTAQDYSRHHFETIGAYNGMIASQGSFAVNDIERWQTNTDYLLVYNKEVNKDISFSLNFGGNAMYDKTWQNNRNTENGLVVPDDYSIDNSVNIPYERKTFYEKAVNSVYGFGQIDYKHFLFVDITGRNDWSSTLPDQNNSYFYPSINSGFVFTQLLPDNKKREKIFPYGKLRLSWATVGNDTDPYRLENNYVVNTNSVYGPYSSINGTIATSNLLPEKLVSKEIGTDLRFFTNKIEVDLTYYHTNSFNQIITLDISSTSGAQRAFINAGNIQNKGIEAQIKVKPISTKKVNWNFNINFTKNSSEVIELEEGVDNLSILEHWGLSIEARPGHAYGDIVGYGIQRDANSNKLVDGNGMYLRALSPEVLGNINPDFSLSFSNSISYKALTFSFLVDAKIGGEMFSGTNMYGNGYSGNFKETLEGRDEWYASEAAREAAGLTSAEWTATGGYLAGGVYETGSTVDGSDVSGQTNSTYVNPYDYWNQFSDWTNEIHEPFIYDASFVKLRELSLTYDFSREFAKSIKMKSASISIFGRNLWLIHSNVPNVYPESFHTNGNGQGYELYSYPTRRSIGLNLNLKF